MEARKLVLPLMLALSSTIIVGCSEEPSTVPSPKATVESSPTVSPTTTSSISSLPAPEKDNSDSPLLPISQEELNAMVNNARVFTAISLSPEMGQKEKIASVAEYVMPEYRIFNKPALDLEHSGEKPDPDYIPPPTPPTIEPNEVKVTRYVSLSPKQAVLETNVDKAVFQLWFAPYNKGDWRITNVAWDNCPITVACPYVSKTVQEAEK